MGKTLKAIKVTENNKQRLIAQFELNGDDYLDELVGYNMIVPFGEHSFPEGYLSDDQVALFYNKTATKLENDWFEIRRSAIKAHMVDIFLRH